jgi:GT2 family glycosyltransferase
LVLNWNGWGHTLACLETLLRLSTPGLRMIVVDNGSTDGSMDRIRDWAEGRLDALPEREPLRWLSHPPVPKPILYRLIDDANPDQQVTLAPYPLVLIRADRNLGYSAANNLGLRHAMAQRDCNAVWLLNNDILAHPDALDALLARLQDPGIGLCGSTVLYHDAPDRIQCQAGARFCRLAAVSRLIGKDRGADEPLPATLVERQLDHLYGASMLVTRNFIQAAGPLPEQYFLYYEEMDWMQRAGSGFVAGYAPASRIYHHKGASAGTGTRRTGRSASADYYLARSRLRFTRAHMPGALPLVLLLLLAEAGVELVRGHGSRVRTLLRAIADAGRPV